MAISVVGTPTEASAPDGGDAVLSLPSGLQAGDVVYVFSGVTAATPVASTTPSGWTKVESTYDYSFVRTDLYRKTMGGTPDTSVTIVGTTAADSSCAAVAIALRGVDTSTPEDATPTYTGVNAANPDPASITTVTDGAYVLVFAASSANDTSVTVPSGYSNHVQITQADTVYHVTVAGATKLITTAGAENPGSWTAFATGRYATWTVAVRPSTTSAIVGETTLTFTTAGILLPIGGIIGDTSLTFSTEGIIQGLVAAEGTSTISFSLEGVALATGVLSGATTISFSLEGEILVYPYVWVNSDELIVVFPPYEGRTFPSTIRPPSEGSAGKLIYGRSNRYGYRR